MFFKKFCIATRTKQKARKPMFSSLFIMHLPLQINYINYA